MGPTLAWLAWVARASTPAVAAAARAQDRAVVTENVADFAAEREVGLLFIPQKYLPAGGAQAPALAAILDRWADEHPEPYLGSDWPRTQQALIIPVHVRASSS